MTHKIDYSVTPHGDLVATITITGGHDIYRLASALSRAQCDFITQAESMARFLKLASPQGFASLDRSLGGNLDRLAGEGSRTVRARTARRKWRCDGCEALIPAGHLYVETVVMPGDCDLGQDVPARYRGCLDCSKDVRSREALGVHAVREATGIRQAVPA